MSDADFRSADEESAAERAERLDESVTGRDEGPAGDTDVQQAAEGLTTPAGTEEHYSEMTERGARQKGEGSVP